MRRGLNVKKLGTSCVWPFFVPRFQIGQQISETTSSTLSPFVPLLTQAAPYGIIRHYFMYVCTEKKAYMVRSDYNHHHRHHAPICMNYIGIYHLNCSFFLLCYCCCLLCCMYDSAGSRVFSFTLNFFTLFSKAIISITAFFESNFRSIPTSERFSTANVQMDDCSQLFLSNSVRGEGERERWR